MGLIETSVGETGAFLHRALPSPPARIVEVGCGGGEVTEWLLGRGYTVAALDPDPAAVARAQRRGVPVLQQDFLCFQGGGADAVVFSRSLHHMPDLGAALAHARTLLRPRGLCIADEVALERADRAAARWVYDREALLRAAGVLAEHEEPSHLPPAADPLERWRAGHDHEPPLHEGAAMLAELGRQFSDVTVEECPYLHRYLADRLAPDERGGQIARALLAQEREGIAEGALRPMGLHLVAR